MKNNDQAMISIKSQHAMNIVDGSKTVELRRRFLPMPRGSRLWIYATLPVGAIVATATIVSIEHDQTFKLWDRYRFDVAVSKELFSKYFEGCSTGYAIRMTNIEAISPVSLDRIREIRGRSHIPQVATKISSHEASRFEQFRLS
ncbi:MAG: ASCH domain-containing protein [Roseibium sp.]|uniref:ASCH domain-containing protein n=1 Tax=Roseibium sp. TaxID=1936156 RepID=UPI003D9BFE92